MMDIASLYVKRHSSNFGEHSKQLALLSKMWKPEIFTLWILEWNPGNCNCSLHHLPPGALDFEKHNF